MGKRKPVVTVLQGLPASGKSTHAKWMSDQTGAIRLNLDEIRSMMGFGQGTDKWTKALERVAFETQLRALVAAVEQGHDVVLDNTHVAKSMPEAYKVALDRHPVRFELGSFMHVPIEVCINRDLARAYQGEQVSVGEEVIHKLHRRYLDATKGGWHLTADWLNEPIGGSVSDLGVIKPYVAPEDGQDAILVDLDGTLFKMNGRGPHDYHRVEEDLINPPVAEVVKWAAAQGYAILLATGRPETAKGFDVRAATVRALRKAGVFYDHLWMRPTNDFRKDIVVKLEIFDREIRHNYRVLFSLDDRNQVVDGYREGLELPCWQVAKGAF